MVKVNEGSHEGLAEIGEQIRDGCEMLACMDYVIESASRDVTVKWCLHWRSNILFILCYLYEHLKYDKCARLKIRNMKFKNGVIINWVSE